MNIGETIDNLVAQIKDIAPNIKWAALGFVAGMFATWLI